MPPSVCVLPAHSSKQVHIAGIGISDKHNADYCAQSSEIKCLETRPPQGIRRQTHEPIRAARTDCGCYVGAGFWPTSGNVTSGGAMLSGLDENADADGGANPCDDDGGGGEARLPNCQCKNCCWCTKSRKLTWAISWRTHREVQPARHKKSTRRGRVCLVGSLASIHMRKTGIVATTHAALKVVVA